MAITAIRSLANEAFGHFNEDLTRAEWIAQFSIDKAK